MDMRIPVLIIEPSQIIRNSLRHHVSLAPFRSLGAFASARAIPSNLHSDCKPHVLIIGLSSDFPDFVDILVLHKRFPAARIVVLSDDCTKFERSESFRLGAVAFLQRNLPPEMMSNALKLVSMEDVILFSGAANATPEPRFKSPEADCAFQNAGLSPREATILELIKEGDSNKHIARRLGIAEATVKCHVKSILRKVSARNRFDAAMWALRLSGTNEAKSSPPHDMGEPFRAGERRHAPTALT